MLIMRFIVKDEEKLVNINDIFEYLNITDLNDIDFSKLNNNKFDVIEYATYKGEIYLSFVGIYLLFKKHPDYKKLRVEIIKQMNEI